MFGLLLEERIKIILGGLRSMIDAGKIFQEKMERKTVTNCMKNAEKQNLLVF